MDATALETGSMFVIAIGLIEIIMGLIRKRANGKGEKSALSENERHQLKTLHSLHTRFDDDGAPLWYVPRSWGESQKQIAELLKDVSRTQKNQTKILEKIAEQLS